jgi:hypothetical protein
LKKKNPLHRYILYILFISFWGIQCAQPAPPQGGPKDEQPPVIDTEKSLENYQTNFTIQDIEIYFNEYIDVRDVFKQVIVSPPLDNLPKVTAKLKRLKFEFPEGQELKENTTYTINFGSSIRDFTEGNTLKDFRFVFSTGDFIDSLEMSGSVVNAFDGNDEEGVVVMLYDNFNDSIVYQEKPYYFATTDKNGKFEFQNLRSDTFKIFALKDGNLNYIYDAETESIGFLDDKIIVNDSSVNQLELELFLPIQKTKILQRNVGNYGIASTLFNKPPKEITYELIGDVDQHYSRIDKDSLILYYQLPGNNSAKMVVKEGSDIIDTLNLNSRGRQKFLDNASLILGGSNLSKAASLPANLELELNLNHPVLDVVDSLFILKDTSGLIQPLKIEIDSVEKRQIRVKADWKKGDEYSLQILPQGIVDYFGLTHDTINTKIRIKDELVYGKIILTVDSLDIRYNYILELKMDKKWVGEEIIVKDSVQILTFDKQEPGSYSVRIIEDRNSNGRWDPGDYLKKEQSEQIFSKNIGDLRENWEMNESIHWNKDQ